MKKVFPIIALCLLMIISAFVLTSCGNDKEALSSKEFKKELGSGFEYEDLTSQYVSKDPTVEEVIYAKNEDGLEIQYWRHRDKLSAAAGFHDKRHKMAKYCPDDFDWEKGKDETLFAEGKNKTAYFKAAKIDDTVVYSASTLDNQVNVDKIFDKLGYDKD